MRDGKPNNDKLVLVVDDDRFVRKSLSKLLVVKGYSVLEAENGQQALEVLETTPHVPRVILLDLRMPVVDGREFLKLRAEDPMLRRIPVVVISGSPLSGEPLDGIDSFLPKPVDADRLIKIIRTGSG